MKNKLKLISLSLFFISLLSSCGTTLYYNRAGVINVPKQSSYEVTYLASLGNNVGAKITFTDQGGKKIKLSNISNKWTKTVTLLSGQRVKFKIVTKSDNKELSQFKVLVNGKAVSEKEIKQDKSKYYYSFILP